jgi:hypothetical protein
MKTTKVYIILIDLGYRIARVRTIANNYAHALLKTYRRFNHKQVDFAKYQTL